MDILNKWIDDLPHQFQGKPRIESLLNVFSKQIEELYDVYNQLDMETDLDTAIGKNLDRVGDIMNLSRKDAHLIVRAAENAEITDSLYRQVLRYKAIVNSCDCTYYDIMDSINLLWNTDNIEYVESEDRPATVLLTMPTVSLDSIDPAVGRILTLKPAGVAMVYTVGYWADFLLMNYERFLFNNLRLHWKLLFYQFAFGDRVRRLDGTWLLDGSVLLSSFTIDVPVIIKYSGIVLDWPERIGMNTAITAKVQGIEKAESDSCTVRAKVNEIQPVNALDGTWELDGSRLLNSTLWAFENAVSMATAIRYADEIKSAYLITRKNIWYLDGSNLLDGSRYLNAIEYKEVL